MKGRKGNVESSTEQTGMPGNEQQATTEQAQSGTETGNTGNGAQTITRKPRTRDPRLDERDAIVAAWKAAGNKGSPEGVKVADFKRIAQRRLDDALESLRRLGHCGNRNNYSYTEEQAAKMMAALANAVSDVEQAFAPKGTSVHRVEL